MLTQVARAMQADLQALKAALDTVQSGGLVTSMDTGMSDAAYGLGDATGNAFSGISQYMDDLITAQQAVIDRINQSAAVYADTEANNVALVNGVSTGGSVPVGGTLTSGTAAGAGSWTGGAAGAGSGGSLGTGSGGSLAGFTPPPSGGGGTLSAPAAPGPVGPAPGGSPIAPVSPIAPFPLAGGASRGSLPGELESGQPVPGEPVPGEPVPGEPVAGEPVLAEPVPGAEPIVGEPVIGGRGAAMLGGGAPAEVESAALGERSLANGLGIIGGEDSEMLAESPAVNGVLGIGAADDAVAAGGLGATATGEAGGLMPAGTAGGGRAGHDGERPTWMTEDSDVWSGNEDVAPPVIGDSAALGRRR